MRQVHPSLRIHGLQNHIAGEQDRETLLLRPKLIDQGLNLTSFLDRAFVVPSSAHLGLES